MFAPSGFGCAPSHTGVAAQSQPVLGHYISVFVPLNVSQQLVTPVGIGVPPPTLSSMGPPFSQPCSTSTHVHSFPSPHSPPYTAVSAADFAALVARVHVLQSQLEHLQASHTASDAASPSSTTSSESEEAKRARRSQRRRAKRLRAKARRLADATAQRTAGGEARGRATWAEPEAALDARASFTVWAQHSGEVNAGLSEVEVDGTEQEVSPDSAPSPTTSQVGDAGDFDVVSPCTPSVFGDVPEFLAADLSDCFEEPVLVFESLTEWRKHHRLPDGSLRFVLERDDKGRPVVQAMLWSTENSGSRRFLLSHNVWDSTEGAYCTVVIVTPNVN